MNNILIIGLGLIGGSIAKSLHTNNHELNIFAFDQNSSPISIKYFFQLSGKSESLLINFRYICSMKALLFLDKKDVFLYSKFFDDDI